VITASTHIPTPVHAMQLQHSVLKVLLYYDLFQYPLTAEEIYFHCEEKNCTKVSVEHALSQLIVDEKIFRHDQFYSVRNAPELSLRRKSGNKMAAEVMEKVHRRSKLIASFPFVRGICISGSLSKNYFDESTDVDFFIITEPNRLWICRTFLVLFKKIFLLNNKKYFCVNYFIDTESLQIPDKNIFTATEIVTLIPTYNYGLYRQFYEENKWVKSFFPNCEPRVQNGTWVYSSRIKRVTEKLLRGNFGEWLDKLFFKRTIQHWRKKFGHLAHHEFEVNMRSRRSVSKHHPQGYQFQVLQAYNKRIQEFERQHQEQFREDAVLAD
jgi:hypothetical protein